MLGADHLKMSVQDRFQCLFIPSVIYVLVVHNKSGKFFDAMTQLFIYPQNGDSINDLDLNLVGIALAELSYPVG